MATKQVNIDIIAKDKTRMAMRSAQMGIDRVKNSVFNLRNAFLGIGAGFIAKGFLDTAREVERLQVRFKFLFSDVEEGERAFKGLIKFASQVPFSLEEIQRGSANLAVVSKDAKELNTLLKITGDIASASGLDFQTTAEQIQRTFSGGINSADLFRERGVKALLGFEAGVQISAEQSRQHILKAFREGTLSVVGASDEMAKTFDGTLSMIGDKFNLFKMAVMDSAPFDFLKRGAMVLEQELEKNFGSIEKAGQSFGKAFVETLKDILMGGAMVLDFFAPMFSFLRKSIVNLIEIAQRVPAPFDTLGIIGFLMLGRKGKALVLLIGGFIDDIRSGLGSILSAMISVEEFANKFTFQKFFDTKDQKEFVKRMAELKLRVEELKTPLTDLEKKQGELGDTSDKSLKTMSAGFDIGIQKSDFFTKTMAKLLEKFNKVDLKAKEFKKTQKNLLEGLSGQETNILPQNMLPDVGLTGSEMNIGSSPKIIALQQMADLELEIEKATADKRLEIAKDTAKKQKEIMQQNLNNTIHLLKSGRGEELNFEKLTGEQKQDLAVKVGREALAEMARNNEKAFKLNKAFNLAEAIMSTARGVAKALPNIPLAVAIGALGAVQIATIAKTKYQGRRLGGRMNKGEPYMVGEAGAEMVVPDAPSTVIPNNKLNSVSQPVTVNFNINTVDARGFNELLVNSRGTIINLINSAVNEKGKAAIV